MDGRGGTAGLPWCARSPRRRREPAGRDDRRHISDSDRFPVGGVGLGVRVGRFIVERWRVIEWRRIVERRRVIERRRIVWCGRFDVAGLARGIGGRDRDDVPAARGRGLPGGNGRR
jgi:hypothetical protein